MERAFSIEAGLGGFSGVLIQGFRRAAFSNEAGIGSASIAHSAATDGRADPRRARALLEPFIDTIVVCTMTGLVIVVTGAHSSPEAGSGITDDLLCLRDGLPLVPGRCCRFTAVLFAFSTMISWSYYGEQCWASVFGLRSILVYKVLFLMCAWAGAVFSAQSVLDFGDLMILGMAFPNIAGVVLLSGKIKQSLDSYLRRLAAGEFVRHEPT